MYRMNAYTLLCITALGGIWTGSLFTWLSIHQANALVTMLWVTVVLAVTPLTVWSESH